MPESVRASLVQEREGVLRLHTFAAFDLDGTLFRGNSSFAFCCYLHRRKKLSTKSLLFCVLYYILHLFGFFSIRRLHHVVFQHLFRGKKAEEITSCIAPFIQEVIPSFLCQRVLHRLRKMQKQGISLAIFSASPLFLVAPIAAALGITQVYASEYKTDEMGRLTGVERVFDGHAKAAQLQQIGENQLTYAFSDSHHDLVFLESASVPVVVNPSRRLRKTAQQRAWEVL